MTRGGGTIDETRLAFTIIALALTAFGLFFLGIGVVQLRRERAFARVALASPGTVIGFERRRYVTRRNGRRRVVHHDHPVVQYTTHAGQSARFVSPTGTSPRIHREGETVTVLYNEGNPTDARIAGGTRQFGLPIIFMIVGGGLTLIGLIFGLIARFSLA